jgi:PAS domain S-box-containing protein
MIKELIMETEKQKRFEELESSERNLRKENGELRDFLENASVPLHWVNGSGIIIWVNKAELEMLGYSKDEFVNQHIGKFHADKDVIEDILGRLMNKETLINYPARLVCKNGDIRHVLINSNVYWEADKFIHTRCFTRDITNLKAIETEREELIKNLQSQVQQLQAELGQRP